MSLSRETIRFRLWQFRQLDRALSQKEAAEQIGCTVEALRAAQPRGWSHGGPRTDQPNPTPDSTEVDTFLAEPERFMRHRTFRSQFVEHNGGLF